MKSSRFLTIINLLGCAFLTALIVFQWLRERNLSHQIKSLTGENAALLAKFESEQTRSQNLEHDVAQLKEAIESTIAAKQQAEETLAKQLAEKLAEKDALTATQLTANQQQTEAWQRALSERDARLRTLSSDLLATRKRLSEAIEKLKKGE